MKKVWIIAIGLALIGCKKEEPTAPKTQGQTQTPTTSVKVENVTNRAPETQAPSVTVAAPTTKTAPTPTPEPPKVNRADQAKAALEQLLAEWQADKMPKDFVDTALIFTRGGVTARLLEYKVNALIPYGEGSPNFRGTANVTVEGKPTMQIRVMMQLQDDGRWRALVSR